MKVILKTVLPDVFYGHPDEGEIVIKEADDNYGNYTEMVVKSGQDEMRVWVLTEDLLKVVELLTKSDQKSNK